MEIDWTTATVRVSVLVQGTANADRQEIDLPLSALRGVALSSEEAAITAEALFAASGRRLEAGLFEQADELAKLCHRFALLADGAEHAERWAP